MTVAAIKVEMRLNVADEELKRVGVSAQDFAESLVLFEGSGWTIEVASNIGEEGTEDEVREWGLTIVDTEVLTKGGR